jgi:hypothetical protein
MTAERFQLMFVSDVRLEHLAVEIQFNGQRLCMVSRERGIDQMQVEFLTNVYVVDADVVMQFPLAEFEHAVSEARRLLAEAGNEKPSVPPC